jgi:hypothetical protein
VDLVGESGSSGPVAVGRGKTLAGIRFTASFEVVGPHGQAAAKRGGRQANRAAVRQFDQAIAGLRWSDPRLTLLVHDLSIREDAAVKVGAPDLCADLQTWAHSGYRRIPASTERYNSRVAAVVTMAGQIIEAAADWWQEHLPTNERGKCRRFPRGRYRRGYVIICSGGLPEPATAACERRVIEESGSIGKAIWNLLAHYEDGSTRSFAQRVERHDAELQASLTQTYFSLVSRLSRSVGFQTVGLPTELGLLGLSGAPLR